MPDFDDKAHEIWAAAQLMPGEGIIDGVARIKEILSEINVNKKCPNCGQIAPTYSLGEVCSACHCER